MGQVLKEGADILNKIAGLMKSGCKADSKEVQEQIKNHHKYIDQSFYPCSLEIYSGLSDLYIQDIRFTAYYEKITPGLAGFMSDAMKICCGKK